MRGNPDAHIRVCGAGHCRSGGGNRVPGGLLITVGLLIITGADRAFKAAIVSVSPNWLIQLTIVF